MMQRGITEEEVEEAISRGEKSRKEREIVYHYKFFCVVCVKLGEMVKVGKSEHSLIIRIPTRLAKFMKLEKGEQLSTFPEGKNRLIMESVTKRP